MVGNANDAEELHKLVRRITSIAMRNKWPISVLCLFKDGHDAEIGACSSVLVNPSDPDVMAGLSESKIGKSMMATLLTYQVDPNNEAWRKA